MRTEQKEPAQVCRVRTGNDLFSVCANIIEVMNSTVKKRNERAAVLLRAGWYGIIVDGLLAGLKIAVGVVSNSVAVLSEGVNNLSDCAASVISVILSKFIGRNADSKHPYGYGRTEYIASLLISLLILFGGGNLVVESVQRILKPEVPAFDWIGIAVLIVSAVSKLFLGNYQIRTGRMLKLPALEGAGREAKLDVVQSLATLLCIFLLHAFHLNLDAYFGLGIACILVKTGIDILRTAFDSLLGESADPSLVREIRQAIEDNPGVLDVFHITLQVYGPLNQEGIAEVALSGDLSVQEASEVTRQAAREIERKFGIRMRFIIYPQMRMDEEGKAMYECVQKYAQTIPGTRSIHGFSYDRERNILQFCVLVDYSVTNARKYRKTLSDAIRLSYPDAAIMIDLERE